jgi:hypothetical protein
MIRNFRGRPGTFYHGFADEHYVLPSKGRIGCVVVGIGRLFGGLVVGIRGLHRGGIPSTDGRPTWPTAFDPSAR